MQIENIADMYPLSPMQQGMLFHSLYAPDSGVYFTQLSGTLRGTENIAVFRQALERMVERHPILRTAFVWEGLDEPLQIVRQKAGLPYEEHDWRTIPASEHAARFDALREADRQRGFAFSEAPLMRLTVVRIEDEGYEFIWSNHHLLLDGWSFSVLLREVFAACEAIRNGRLYLEPEPRPYRDFIAWLAAQDTAGSSAYWRGVLAGITEPTRLTANLPRPESAPASSEAVLSRELPPALSETLAAFSRRHGLTLNTLVQAAWALLLARYSGRGDVVFGSTVAGRPAELAGVDSMIGLFINTIPVRVVVRPEERLLPWLNELQRAQTEARQFQYASMIDIQAAAGIPSGTPLFDTILVFENYPVDSAVEQALASSGVRNLRFFEKANYPLTLIVNPGARLSLRANFDPCEIGSATAGAILEQLGAALERMVGNAEQRVGEVALLSAAERRLVVEEWNRTATDFPVHASLAELAQAQATRTPDRIAVRYGSESLTFSELNRRANQLAQRLLQLGVGSDSPVAVALERSCELIVALLAIVKAGAPYLPLDPAYPSQRLAFMLADSGARLLLTRSTLGMELDSSVPRLYVDRESEQIAALDGSDLPARSTAAELAYIMYTSGSTGTPKGIAIPQRAIVRLIVNSNYVQLNEQDRMGQTSNVCFDAATFEIWGALLSGACLVGISKEVALAPEEFAAQLRADRITTLFLTTALFNRLAAVVPEGFAGMRQVLFGGEAVDPQSVRRVLEAGGPERLLHVYGPTESTTFATWHWVEKVAVEASTIPIGRGLSNTSVYVLDRWGEPVPVGVTGELYLGGEGLAREYWRRPELTAERFVPDGFSGKQGARLYRTGDLVRWRREGEIEFVGRADEQVKIRGFRIEVGEIEAVLVQHERVREAAVVAREDVPGSKRLVGYVVVEGEGEGVVGQLRRYLQERLPEYMVPQAMVVMEKLPLNANGKVDRRALPAPDGARQDQAGAFVAPRNAIERILAGIWASVLRLDKIGVHDNFFELGGDSILAIQIISRANQAGISLSPRQLLERQTIAELAAVAEEAQAAKAEQGTVAGDVLLTPIQYWFFEQELEEPHHWNQAVLLQLDRRYGPGLVERVVAKLVEHHDVLRSRFHKDRDGWRQFIEPVEREPVFAFVDLSAIAPGGQREAIESAAARFQASLNLENGPLVRAAYLDCGRNAGTHGARLLLAIHHLVVDGVSWRILLEDLHAGLLAAERGEEIRLPAKSSSFRQWSSRLAGHARSVGLEPLAQWLAELRKPADALPVDFPGETRNTRDTAVTISCELDAERTAALLERVPAVYRTQIDEVLLAALVLAFNKRTGHRSLLVDFEGHGRAEGFGDLDLSRTVGWFTSVAPVRLEVPKEQGIRPALQSVKEQLRRMPNRGWEYGLLRYLATDTDAGRAARDIAQPQISFNYLGQFDGLLEQATAFRMAEESHGPVFSPRGRRRHLVEVNGRVQQRRLQFEWTYSTSMHRHATIEGWAGAFIDALAAIVAHCDSPEAGGFTPSDFPLAKLNGRKLARVASLLGNAHRKGK